MQEVEKRWGEKGRKRLEFLPGTGISGGREGNKEGIEGGGGSGY